MIARNEYGSASGVHLELTETGKRHRPDELLEGVPLGGFRSQRQKRRISLRRKGGRVREYSEVACISAADVLGEISRKAEEDFEFVSVIVKRPATFLLRMRRKRSYGPGSLLE